MSTHISTLSEEQLQRLERRQHPELQALWETLEAVKDPEIPVLSIFDLGILRDIEREGEMDDRFYIIVSGQCDVEANGNKLGQLSDGDCFGETSYVHGAKRTASITANGPITILRVSSTLMEQVSQACQLRFNKVFLRSLITRLQGDGTANT